MAEPAWDRTSSGEQGGRPFSAWLQRAAGLEVVTRELARIGAETSAASHAILAAIDLLQQRATAEGAHQSQKLEARLDEALHRTEQGLQRTLSHLDERATDFHAALLANLRNGSETFHSLTAHLDRRLEELLARFAGDVHAETARLETSLFEHRWQQNAYFSRNSLPSALDVKRYYLQLKSAPAALDFEDVGVSVFSQNTEDGILLYIFSVIGMQTRRCIEIGCDLSGSTIGIPEGNTINLICNFGFDGLIVDLEPSKTAAIRHFFARALSTKHYHRPAMDGRPAGFFSPAVLTREITAENINAVLAEAGFTGEVDLLSIDVDGPDLSLWTAVRDLSPRVVIIEINNRLAFDSVISGHYTVSTAAPESLEYQQSRSSSLAAVCHRADEKGYIFVGMDMTLLNAFFVRRDAWDERLPVRTPADFVTHRLNPLLPRPA